MSAIKKESKRLRECYYRLRHESGLDVYVFPKKLTVSYALQFADNDRTLYIEVKDGRLYCSYPEEEKAADVNAKLTRAVMERIVDGRVTFQGAFMSGDITAKGDFKLLRQFDMKGVLQNTPFSYTPL